MPYDIKTVEVWAGDMVNRPGMLARVLEALSGAGANLEFVIARRVNETTSRGFYAPVKGKKQQRAAADVGLQRTAGMHALRIEGPDKPGLGAFMTRAVAGAGINLRGVSAASLGKRSVCYIAFDKIEDAKEAGRVLKKVLPRR
jgi:hypothetical protein